MKRFLKHIIILLINLIEKFEYSGLELDENDITKKIINTIDLTDVYVETDNGMSPISEIHITQPYKIYNIKTESGKQLSGADNHIIFDENMNQVFINDLNINDSIQTRDGIEKIINITTDKHSISMFDISVNDSNHRYYSNNILSHNTVTSAIYIAWYVCFHFDRNALIVANKQVTAGEIVGKVRNVIQNLPLFLQPGVIGGGIGGIIFDNGCKLFSSPTSKTSGLGFTIHLLYADEFAHIPQKIVVPFYRSIYPTLSSSKISQIIITSTPNGLNKFHEIYSRSEDGINTYHHERVDWWEIPGRDEAWKAKEIANLGSIEMFEQEHGNQFLINESSMINSDIERLLKKTTSKYIYKNLYLENPKIDNLTTTSMKWHNQFNPLKIDKNDKFVITIDLADGSGGDYTEIDFFKIEPKSKAKINKMVISKAEKDFFRFKQVGIFSSNKIPLPKVAEFLISLLEKIFIPDNLTIVVEINFKGSYFLELLYKYDDIFYDGLLLYTYQAINATHRKPGVRMRSDNKNIFAVELRQRLSKFEIIITEDKTFKQLAEFSLNTKGFFEGVGKYDDKAMSVLLLMAYINDVHFDDDIGELLDHVNNEFKELMHKKLFDNEEKIVKEENPYSSLNPDSINKVLGYNAGLSAHQEETLRRFLDKGKF